MQPRKADRPRKDWYSISVDTLRGWGFLLGTLAVLGALYGVYLAWERTALQRDARQAIDEARRLIQKIQPEGRASEFKSGFDAAWQSFEQARADYGRGAYQRALDNARRSRAALQTILESLSPAGPSGQASFFVVQGEVEYRRASGGDWEEARSRVQLRPGDYVRTGGSGSATVRFGDGALYTVRPNTQVIVAASRPGSDGPAEQSIQMEYGWLDLSTAGRASRVTTPSAEAHIKRESEAFVTFDKTSRRGRFGAIRGGVELSSKGGLTRRIGPLQQVAQTGDLLSSPEPLPGRPEPVEPMDNLEVNMGAEQRLVLAWAPVAGAARYALQVSRHPLFVDNVIDAPNRTRTRATLGIRGEGNFQWRVAAFDREGVQGPWSTPRKFRVATFNGRDAEGDKTPPQLDLAEVRTYGSIFIVAGKSEPGCRVEIDGEPVKIEADGSFNKAIQLSKEGWSFIEIQAIDGSGNKTVKRQRVFVENP